MIRLSAASQAFREPALISDPLKNLVTDDFNDFDSRRLRYAIYWSFYENTVFRNIHTWAKRYRIDYGLYKFIRSIYNPSYRLGEFWKSHLWGGRLMEALPIVTENDNLLPVIEQVWNWSNWQINKDICALHGSILGDSIIKIVDDVESERVYLEVIHPGKVKDLEMDNYGNVKAYVIEEQRVSPLQANYTVTYTEIARKLDSQIIEYTTLMNGVPFAWNGDVTQQTFNYGFIPMVSIQHNNVGLDWGWSELHPMREKFNEVDDQASKISDYVRKSVDAPMILVGVQKPSTTPATLQTRLTGSAAIKQPYPGREESPVFYSSDSNAKAIPMLADLDISHALNHLKEMLANLEEELPELRKGIMTDTGDASGRALEVARQPVETKVSQRRPNYDDALMRANMMAISIGASRGYFPGFSADSFRLGDLQHSIGDRPIFRPGNIEKALIDKARFENLKILIKAGLPLQIAALQVGFTQDQVDEWNLGANGT